VLTIPQSSYIEPAITTFSPTVAAAKEPITAEVEFPKLSTPSIMAFSPSFTYGWIVLLITKSDSINDLDSLEMKSSFVRI
jgi:hypothetical protein